MNFGLSKPKIQDAQLSDFILPRPNLLFCLAKIYFTYLKPTITNSVRRFC